MIERYSRKEIKSIWEDYSKYSIWLEIELAAAEAMEKLKIIPRVIVKKIKPKATINIKKPTDPPKAERGSIVNPVVVTIDIV